jgi:hypothetical protein
MIDLFPLDPSLVIPAATASFSAASLFFTCRSINRPRDAFSMKALGTLLVLTLAFAANTGPLYALAIFIVATLVTELSFLEKIAALIWNRGKFWDWMIAKESTPEAEARIAEQARSEAEAAIPILDTQGAEPETGTNDQAVEALKVEAPGPKENEAASAQSKNGEAEHGQTKRPRIPSHASATTRVNEFVSESIYFERYVQQALRESRRPLVGNVKSNLRISSSSASSSFEVDAIVETPSVDYVVEIKYAKTSELLLRGSRHVLRAADAYRAYLRERGRVRHVLPVLIVPANVEAPQVVDSLVPVLKFDLMTSSFTNVNDFTSLASAIRSNDDVIPF